jgi:hypothetical protein
VSFAGKHHTPQTRARIAASQSERHQKRREREHERREQQMTDRILSRLREA